MASPKKPFRKLTRLGDHSYYVVLPPGIIRELGWRERQKLKIHRFGTKIMIESWKKKSGKEIDEKKILNDFREFKKTRRRRGKPVK